MQLIHYHFLSFLFWMGLVNSGSLPVEIFRPALGYSNGVIHIVGGWSTTARYWQFNTMTNQTAIISGYTGAEFPNVGKAFAQTQNGMYMAGSSTGDGVYYFDFSEQANPTLIASFSGTPIDNYQGYNGPSAICVNNDDPN
eukprot:139755_1